MKVGEKGEEERKRKCVCLSVPGREGGRETGREIERKGRGERRRVGEEEKERERVG